MKRSVISYLIAIVGLMALIPASMQAKPREKDLQQHI